MVSEKDCYAPRPLRHESSAHTSKAVLHFEWLVHDEQRFSEDLTAAPISPDFCGPTTPADLYRAHLYHLRVLLRIRVPGLVSVHPSGGLLAARLGCVLLCVRNPLPLGAFCLRPLLRPHEAFVQSSTVALAYQDWTRYGSTDEAEVYQTVIAANIINMALDIMIFILPIPLLFRNDTVRNTKIGLLALFGLGIM